MKFKTLLILFLALILTGSAVAFCGFYVAKADAKLFNKSSQVIIARDGNTTVVTMASDYQGEVKDFAMVVPVPVVLKRKDIRVVRPEIFSKLDGYSGPRLVEYHDPEPCNNYARIMPESVKSRDMAQNSTLSLDEISITSRKVKIEARYEVEEYEILILSAKESNALETWLIENGYKIPEGAQEVLEPYIKNNLKFFVVKVNLDKYNNMGSETLRPLQITYESSNFMLPIRLGMANANDDQDLIIYTFTKKGRVETVNYRTTKIPTDKNIPTFVRNDFGEFYKDLYKKAWKKEGRNSVMLEYAWDLSSSNFVKCDPCATAPPVLADLQDAGVFWVEQNRRGGGSNYDGDVFITRLHVRYNRKTFPQDLVFQITPNTENFQGRYIMTHPASSFNCERGQDYLKELVKRRQKELDELYALTGSRSKDYDHYVEQYKKLIKEPAIEYKKPDEKEDRGEVIPAPDKHIKKGSDDVLDKSETAAIETVNDIEYKPAPAPVKEASLASAPPQQYNWQGQLIMLILLALTVYYVVQSFRKQEA